MRAMIRQIPIFVLLLGSFFIKLDFMGRVITIFSRQIGGAKELFLQSHSYHISDDDVAKKDESFLLSFLMLRFSFLYSQAQYDESDLNKIQKARPKTPTASKVIP